MAETLFDLLDVDEERTTPETRIGPSEWDGHLGTDGAARMVVGGPGTGKTEFLCATVERAVARGVDPERVLVLTFSRRGVLDLRSRLTARIGPPAHRVLVATSHSLATRLVERHAAELGWARPPSLLTGAEQEALVRSLLASEEPGAWPATYRGVLGSEELASEVTDFLLRASEQMLDADDIAARDRADWRALPAFMRRYDGELRAGARLDYGGVLMEAIRLAAMRPDAVRSFDLVVADEYQDTAPAQAELLMACVGPGCDLVVAADPYQSIFSFRGTDIANVYTFPEDVERALGRSTRRLVLDTSLRVPSEILAAAVSVTARELPGGAGRVGSRRDGGVVACHEFATVGDEAEWIASDIERMHLLDGLPLERIAVFVRSHGPLLADLVRALERRGIEHSHSDERVVDEPVIRFAHDLVRAATDPDAAVRSAALRRVLLGPFVQAAQGIVSTMGDDPSRWPIWIRSRLGEHDAIADLLEDHHWADEDVAPDGLWHLWSSIPGLATVAVDPGSARHRRAWAAYAQALERSHARGQRRTLRDQVDLERAVDFETDTLLDVSEGGVTLATLHQAKGTEFDVVFISDAVEGRLPDLRHRDSLLGVRHLHPHLPTATADYVTFRLDEERRLAYTAMTRASTRVVWTATVASDTGGGSAPSRFMRLVAPTTDVDPDSEPLTPRALIASVRRTVADPGAPAVARLAGLSVLARPGPGERGPLDRYGVRMRGSHVGTVPRDLTLSPSQAHDYDRCPRQYAVERFLLSRDDESPYLLLGNLIHEVLERAEAAALADGRPRSSRADAEEAFGDAWGNAGFDDDHVGAAWRRRAGRILDALYEGWPSSGTAVALEAPLEADFGGVPWRGRADRIERVGSSLTIVDYKTSASAATVEEAATSLQLGFYAAAVRSRPDLTAGSTVDGASFWYPAAPRTRSGVATRHLDMTRIEEVVERLAEIATRVQAEEFAPTPHRACSRCSVRSVCPAFPVGREAFT